MGGAVAEVEQVQLIRQQQHDRDCSDHHRQELPDILPVGVGHSACQPVKDAVSMIFGQQQGDAGKAHTKGRQRDTREDQFVSVMGMTKSASCGHDQQPAHAAPACRDERQRIACNRRRTQRAGKRHSQRRAAVNAEQ